MEQRRQDRHKTRTQRAKEHDQRACTAFEVCQCGRGGAVAAARVALNPNYLVVAAGVAAEDAATFWGQPVILARLRPNWESS